MLDLMWFDRAEFLSRLDRVQKAIGALDLDALIAFQPETITWTTGHYTRAYSGYQVAIIPRRGEPTLICRNVSKYYADKTCAFADPAAARPRIRSTIAIRRSGSSIPR